MRISVISVGKIKESYLQDGIKNYVSKISKKVDLKLIEMPDEKAPENLSLALMEQIKSKEGKRILNNITPHMYVITLEIFGKELTTQGLIKLIKEQEELGKKDICFVIGGSLGLSTEVSQRSNFKLSFSKMTLPHQLMKLVLLEQLSTVTAQ